MLGPLTKVWDCLDRANNCSEEEVCINLPDITADLEKAILLLGQASHTIAYQRRLYILSAISKDAREAKQQLKEKAEMINQEDTYLFGKEFQTYISDTAKSRLKLGGGGGGGGSKCIFSNFSPPIAFNNYAPPHCENLCYSSPAPPLFISSTPILLVRPSSQ